MKRRPLHEKLRAPYLYASTRLLFDVYSRVRSSNHKWQIAGLSGTLPGTGLGISMERGSDQPDNIYWLGEFAEKVLPKFELGDQPRGDPPWYLHISTAPLNWTILRVGGTIGPVAWIYGDWHDPRGGRTVLALCGSVENYRELRPGTQNGTTLGWYPSSPMGLSSIMHAMAEGRETEARSDMSTSGQSLISVTDMAFTLTSLPRSQVLASGYTEVLAEVFTFAQNFRVPGAKLDTFILGAPLWICPTVALPLSTRALPPDFQGAIEEDRSHDNLWWRIRTHIANWMMPEKKFLYSEDNELSYRELVSRPALTTAPLAVQDGDTHPCDE